MFCYPNGTIIKEKENLCFHTGLFSVRSKNGQSSFCMRFLFFSLYFFFLFLFVFACCSFWGCGRTRFAKERLSLVGSDSIFFYYLFVRYICFFFVLLLLFCLHCCMFYSLLVCGFVVLCFAFYDWMKQKLIWIHINTKSPFKNEITVIERINHAK